VSAQLLIYESAAPLSRTRHQNSSVQVGNDYSFSRSVNSVPLMAVEFAPAATDYAIVFAGHQAAFMPAVILGLRGNENLYLTDKNGWDAAYVPAFIRRYPFVFSSPDEGKSFTLCIDERFQGLNTEGKGQRLFGDDGKPSEYTDNVLKFLQGYQAQFQRTQTFCKTLQELDLLEPMQAQVTTSTGERLSLGGFMAVSRDRMKKLSADTLAKLMASDELELVYLHLQSMRNFNRMRERLAGTMATG
jgi:hypothetical protein